MASLALALASSPARATASPDDAARSEKVLLLVDDPSSPFAARLRAELSGLGLEPVFDKAPPGSEPSSLDEEASRHGAAAAIRLQHSDRALEIWVADQVTGKTSLRKLSVETEKDPALTVTKAVELLRASLLEAKVDAPVEKARPAPLVAKLAPAAPPEAPRESGVIGSLQLAPALLVSPGGLGPALTVAVRGGYLPSRFVELQASVWIPTGSVTLVAPEGRSSQIFFLGTLGSQLHLVGPDRVVDPTLGLALGLSWVHADGTASAPYKGESAGLVSLVALAEAGLGVRLASTLGLRVDGGCGPTLPRAVLRAAGRAAASWGWPVCEVSLGLRVSFRR